MSRDFIENTFVLAIIALFLVLIYHFGYEMSERKHCRDRGGHYSMDYGECFKGEVLK